MSGEEERTPAFFERLQEEHIKLWRAQRRQKYLLKAINRGERIRTINQNGGERLR